jgi:hypothetical protein
VFARKLSVTLEEGGTRRPVPRAWLEQFFLRDFTGHSAFDETLPTADGILETSFAVDPSEVRSQLGKWLRGRKMIPPETLLTVE